MLKKIYQELVVIRKELQAIRKSLESNHELLNQDLYVQVREPYERRYKFVKLGSGRDGSFEAK